jgi:hypothetical protein
MCFIGHYDSDGNDKCYDYDFEDEDWRDGIDDDEILERLEPSMSLGKTWRDVNEAEFGETKEEDGSE